MLFGQMLKDTANVSLDLLSKDTNVCVRVYLSIIFVTDVLINLILNGNTIFASVDPALLNIEENVFQISMELMYLLTVVLELISMFNKRNAWLAQMDAWVVMIATLVNLVALNLGLIQQLSFVNKIVVMERGLLMTAMMEITLMVMDALLIVKFSQDTLAEEVALAAQIVVSFTILTKLLWFRLVRSDIPQKSLLT